MTTQTLRSVDRDTAPTFARLALPDAVRDAIGAALSVLPDPAADIDRSMTRYHRIFAGLPLEQLQRILDFGRHIDTPGATLVSNLPVEDTLPLTPVDGGPARDKRGFVAEGVLLGLAGLLGEPIGVLTEKDGRLVHDVVPVPGGERTQTNQGSAVFLNFHSDITYDPTGRYDIANPDFLVLNCLGGGPPRGPPPPTTGAAPPRGAAARAPRAVPPPSRLSGAPPRGR
ncbi:hypothetical protein ACFV6K_15495, partial [Streptomyces sp. NPDC059814]